MTTWVNEGRIKGVLNVDKRSLYFTTLYLMGGVIYNVLVYKPVIYMFNLKHLLEFIDLNRHVVYVMPL